MNGEMGVRALAAQIKALSILIKSSGPLIFILDYLIVLLAATLLYFAARRAWSDRAQLLLGIVTTVTAATVLFFFSDPRIIFEDYIIAYWPAGAAVLHGPEGLAPILAQGIRGFVNIPIIAYLFAPFGVLNRPMSSLAFFLFGLGCLAAAIGLIVRAYKLKGFPRGLVMLLIATQGPALYSVREGNASHLLLLPLIGGILLARQRKDILAGVLFGFAALIKLPLMLVGVFFFVRGRWRIVIGGAGISALTVGLSVLVFGLQANINWYTQCIAPFSDPMPAFNNQSVAAMVSKLTLGADSFGAWTVFPLDPPFAILVKVLDVLLLAAVGLAVWRGARAGAPEPQPSAAIEGELMMIIVLACLLSPLSWSHYFVWLALPGAYLVAQVRDGLRRPEVLGLAGLGWLLVMPPVVHLPDPNPSYATIIGNSHLLIGSLLLLCAVGLWRATIRPLPAA